MSSTLFVKHTVSYKDEPLACIENLPGNFADLSPSAMRRLAIALIKAADDCELLAKDSRLYGPVKRGYSLREGQHS